LSLFSVSHSLRSGLLCLALIPGSRRTTELVVIEVQETGITVRQYTTKLSDCQALNSNFWHCGLDTAHYLAKRFLKPKITNKLREVEVLIKLETEEPGSRSIADNAILKQAARIASREGKRGSRTMSGESGS
jgi:hypothetical protein